MGRCQRAVIPDPAQGCSQLLAALRRAVARTSWVMKRDGAAPSSLDGVWSLESRVWSLVKSVIIRTLFAPNCSTVSKSRQGWKRFSLHYHGIRPSLA